MGLSVADIFTRVQRQFGDETSAQVTIDDVVRWINDAMRDIAIANDLLQVKGSMDSVTGQSAYNMPTGIAKLQSVKYNGLVLQSLSLQQADELLTMKDETAAQGFPSGTPEAYWIWAGQINLYPAPSVGGVSALTIYYTREPVDVTAGADTPELPVEYHNKLVDYCIAQAMEMDENFFISMTKMQSFRQGVDELRQNETWENQDSYPFITSTAEDVSGGFITY